MNRNVHCQASGTAGLSLLPARRLLYAFEGGIYMRSGCFRHVRLYSSGSAAKRAAGDSDISGKFDDNLVVEGLFHRPALLQRSAGINNPLVFRAPEF